MMIFYIRYFARPDNKKAYVIFKRSKPISFIGKAASVYYYDPLVPISHIESDDGLYF